MADVGERALIARVRERAGPPPDDVPIGIGDDAAVIVPARGARMVVTTDSLVEDVHFRRGWSSAADVGHKALAVNLSDLAAMGAVPGQALLSLALPDHLPLAEFDALLDGMLALAGRHRVALVGGNLSRSPGPLVVDVTLVGWARPRRILTRSGGRPGDELYVTGQLGRGVAGLAWLRAAAAADGAAVESPAEPALEACVAHYRRPEPRVRVGRLVAASRSAQACMDLSDGLADAVRQVAGASGTGVQVDAGSIPVAPGAEGPEDAPWALALAGGDDYELLFAVPPRRRRAFLAAVRKAGDVPVTRIGTLTRERGESLQTPSGTAPIPTGFAHFS